MGADRFNMQLRFVLLVLLPLFAVAKNELVLKVENVPTAKSKLAVFWQSELHHHHVEKLNVILKPNAMTGILATSGHKFVISTEQSQGHHQEHQAVTCQGGNQAATAHINLRLTRFANVLHKCHIPTLDLEGHALITSFVMRKEEECAAIVTITYLV